MNRFHLLAAVLLISGATAHAEPFVRTSAAQPESAPTPGYVVPVGAGVYQDYPPYPPGFSSYRGLGFMGFCCEPVSPCAASAWDGYCQEKACYESEQGPSLLEKFHAWLCRPAWNCCSQSCGPQSCNPCKGGSGASEWPVSPSGCQGKLLRLRGPRASIPGGCHAGCETCGKGSEPAPSETSEAVEPLPEPTVSEPSTPQTNAEIIPNLPSPPSPDRSASRADLRRLPNVEGSY